MTVSNGNGVWRWVAMSFGGILVGMMIQTFREPKDTVTEKEMSTQILILQNKIDTMSNEVAALRQSVNQIAVDVAQIAEKTGTTAHPVSSPPPR